LRAAQHRLGGNRGAFKVCGGGRNELCGQARRREARQGGVLVWIREGPRPCARKDAGADVDDSVRLPLKRRRVGRSLLEEDNCLHEGRIGREGPSEATALLPRFGLASDGRIDALSGADSAEQRDADVLVKTAVGRPEVDVAAEN